MRNVQKRLGFSMLQSSKDQKTHKWNVRNRRDGILLGTISWFGRWRQYCFDPCSNMTFERNCLRAIAMFCETVTGEHYRKLSRTKKGLNHG
jgi:hypothetical protein